jgi:hypothetical protein
MKYLIPPILMLFLLSGCALGRLSVDEGIAKFAIPFDWPKPQNKEFTSQLDRVYVGMSKSELYELFAGFQQKDYHKEGNKEWITFSTRETEVPSGTVTFHLVGNKVKGWKRE